MKWAVPKAAIEGEMNRKRTERKKSEAFNLITAYVEWRNKNPNMVKKIENIPCLNNIVNYMMKEPE